MNRKFSVREMGEADKNYAVSFAIPSDTEGITYILGRQSCDTRKMEEGNIDQGIVVFVPRKLNVS